MPCFERIIPWLFVWLVRCQLWIVSCDSTAILLVFACALVAKATRWRRARRL